MKCDHCDKSATVRETTVTNGAKVERNLCEACAIQLGVLPDTAAAATGSASQAVYVSVQGRPIASVCGVCGTTLSDFKQHGLLGCADCYKVFEPQLVPLLERAHEGGVAHRGKSPSHTRLSGDAGKRAVAEPSATGPTPVGRVKKVGQGDPELFKLGMVLEQLQIRLKEAVGAEHYEAAAKIRDQIVKLKEAAPEAARASRRKPKPGEEPAP